MSTIKIFRIFYERILGKKDFYAGVMGSISGWMSSPSASVYAAAKAATVRVLRVGFVGDFIDLLLAA